ncbi:hypothetical protein D5086_027182 [Populus alba]|uniref:Uncharacterized protein n=1 Tax=Populus alba TaxID=43335 RepID=A0ACC4B3X0_POPAL
MVEMLVEFVAAYNAGLEGKKVHKTGLKIPPEPSIYAPKLNNTSPLRGLALPMGAQDIDCSGVEGPGRCSPLSQIAGPGQDGSWEFKDIPISTGIGIFLSRVGTMLMGAGNLKGVYGLKEVRWVQWESYGANVMGCGEEGSRVCGFAQSQDAYDSAVNGFIHHTGGGGRSSDYLAILCTKKKLIEYPNLHGYMRDIYQMPKVAETCNFSAIMDGYYKVLFPLNPGSNLSCYAFWIDEMLPVVLCNQTELKRKKAILHIRAIDFELETGRQTIASIESWHVLG